jgi:hypothetical protein
LTKKPIFGYNVCIVNKKELEMEFTIVQGDTIRAYDFKPMLGREDCYLEGEVLDCNAVAECGYNAYKVRVTRDVWDGVKLAGTQGVRVGTTMFVPWKTSFGDFQGRVINLSR